jgi:hypothetical protein
MVAACFVDTAIQLRIRGYAGADVRASGAQRFNVAGYRPQSGLPGGRHGIFLLAFHIARRKGLLLRVGE